MIIVITNVMIMAMCPISRIITRPKPLASMLLCHHHWHSHCYTFIVPSHHNSHPRHHWHSNNFLLPQRRCIIVWGASDDPVMIRRILGPISPGLNVWCVFYVFMRHERPGLVRYSISLSSNERRDGDGRSVHFFS